MKHDSLRSNRAPLYLQVAEELRQRIRRGTWASGELLPTLDVLMAEFGVAKVTVRQAVKLLEQEGLLAPQRGRGTTVLDRPSPRRPLNVRTTLADLVNMYRGDVPEVRDLEDGEAALPDAVPDGVTDPLYHRIRRVHSRDGERYCVITLYLARDIFSRHAMRFRNELVLPVLFDDPAIGVERARQTMLITKCDIATADLLGLSVGEPMAEVRRILYDRDGRVVYLADVIYRGDYIRLDMDLRP